MKPAINNGHSIIPFIRDRKNIKPVRLSLEKILDMNDMGQYLSLCSNRIAEAELIDSEDVEINFANFPDLIITEDGLLICYKILAGYIGEGKLDALWERTKKENEIRKIMNLRISNLKMIKSRDLRRFLRHPKKLMPDIDQMDEEIIGKLKMECREEIRSRCLINRARVFIKEHFKEICIQIKYAQIISVVRDSARECMREFIEE